MKGVEQSGVTDEALTCYIGGIGLGNLPLHFLVCRVHQTGGYLVLLRWAMVHSHGVESEQSFCNGPSGLLLSACLSSMPLP